MQVPPVVGPGIGRNTVHGDTQGRLVMRCVHTIVCLANSRKPPEGRCVAGRQWSSRGAGAWVRAVSSRPTQELTPHERCYADGSDPQVLDVVCIEMQAPRPDLHQRENYEIDPRRRWTRRGQIGWQALQSAIEDPAGPLWINGHSSYNGHNDRVPQAALHALPRSLYLIRPLGLRLLVVTESRSDFDAPKRRLRAQFGLCGHEYLMPVTDPWIEARMLAGADGEFLVDEALLCISLGACYREFAYKLAATVITPQRAGA